MVFQLEFTFVFMLIFNREEFLHSKEQCRQTTLILNHNTRIVVFCHHCHWPLPTHFYKVPLSATFYSTPVGLSSRTVVLWVKISASRLSLELTKVLTFASQGPEHHQTLGTLFDKDSAVFFLDLIVSVALVSLWLYNYSVHCWHFLTPRPSQCPVHLIKWMSLCTWVEEGRSEQRNPFCKYVFCPKQRVISFHFMNHSKLQHLDRH